MGSFYFILRMLKELGKHLLFVHDSRVFNFVRHSEGRKSLKNLIAFYFFEIIPRSVDRTVT